MVPQAQPEVLPVFPLTGSLLLPGNFLPLNVFEPRYRNLVRDAMSGDRYLGMIQPRTPIPDNLGPVAGVPTPELYSVGCAGWIQECEPQPDGRFVILLRGVRRFRVVEELRPHHGYRRVVPDFERFAGDLAPDVESLQPQRLLAAVSRFGERHDLHFDQELLTSLPALTLVNALSAALPFQPGEKQALLEARTTAERERLLLELMDMGIEPQDSQPCYSPPVVN